MRVIDSEKGMALVLTLMIVVLITALVVEFSYSVYTTTSALYNWRDSQRLSFIAKSGITMAVNAIPEMSQAELYKYLGKNIPAEGISEGFNGSLVIRAEDENSKFNLNSVIKEDGRGFFENLLDTLGLDKDIALKVLDWMDSDNQPKLPDSEDDAKNALMESVDELLFIKGIDYPTYETLLPYVTVFAISGTDDSRVNINTASIPVIMSLTKGVPKETAEDIVKQRPHTAIPTGLPSSRIAWQRPTNFRITSIAEENKIKRVIECVVNIDINGQATVKYWREM